MTEIMNSVANAILSWALTIWNFCLSSWILAFPIALALLSRLTDNLKRFLGK